MMKKQLPLLALATAFTSALAPLESRATLWINEFHYDNAGGDVGEFVEVVVGPDMSGVDLSDVTLSLYNGNGGAIYESKSLSDFDVELLVNGYHLYSLVIAGIQNGSPDGMALDHNGTLIEFISYEGSFLGVGGPADGVLSTDVGVSESSDTPIGSSLGLTGGPGSMASDFTWTSFAASPGGPNSGQSFPSASTNVPESGGTFPLLGMAVGGLAWLKIRRPAQA